MKLKAIATLFKQNKRLIIQTDEYGNQWVCNGYAMYLIQGIPKITPEIMLRIFDIPTDDCSKWHCQETDMPETIDFSDSTPEETEIQPFDISIEWRRDRFILFKSGLLIYAIKYNYLKPLMGKEYLKFYQRTDIDGNFILAVKIGFDLKAIIMPNHIHKDEGFSSQIAGIARLFEFTTSELNRPELSIGFFDPEDNESPEVDPDTGEVLNDQTTL